jgi:VWFA-related protein
MAMAGGLAFACLLVVPAFAQTDGGAKPAASSASQTSPAATARPGPQTTLSVDARLVTLPVTVRDKKGKIVSGLTKADFSLTEDGRPQTIKNFAVDTNLPLTLGLLVDTSGSMRDSLDKERTASKSFLDSMLTKSADRAFLLHFDREVELLQDLTASKDKLERSLGELGPTQADPDSSTSNARRSGTTLYDAIYLGADDLMRKQQGRKAMIVLSDGEDRGSKETLSTAIEAAQRAETVVYTIYFKGEEHTSSPFNQGSGRRGGMGGGYPGGGYPGGGYPGGGGGYPRGGGGQQPSQESHVDGKKIMAQIAGETGGFFFEAKKTENLDAIYASIAEELRTQYILSYTPDKQSADQSGFHKVQLTTTKKDVFIQTRPGYYSGQ